MVHERLHKNTMTPWNETIKNIKVTSEVNLFANWFCR